MPPVFAKPSSSSTTSASRSPYPPGGGSYSSSGSQPPPYPPYSQGKIWNLYLIIVQNICFGSFILLQCYYLNILRFESVFMRFYYQHNVIVVGISTGFVLVISLWASAVLHYCFPRVFIVPRDSDVICLHLMTSSLLIIRYQREKVYKYTYWKVCYTWFSLFSQGLYWKLLKHLTKLKSFKLINIFILILDYVR